MLNEFNKSDGLELPFRKSAPHLLGGHVYIMFLKISPNACALVRLWLSNGRVYVNAALGGLDSEPPADRIINLVTNTVSAAVP